MCVCAVCVSRGAVRIPRGVRYGKHVAPDETTTTTTKPRRRAPGRQGTVGVTVKRTETALVVGIYGEGVSPNEANAVVEELGEYLKQQGI